MTHVNQRSGKLGHAPSAMIRRHLNQSDIGAPQYLAARISGELTAVDVARAIGWKLARLCS